MKTKKYRIPSAPVGQAYYRSGTMYEPGMIVILPEDEIPPGWVKDEKTGVHPRSRHAWKLIEPGKKEKSDEEISALEAARAQAAELAKQLEEQQRLLAELEAKVSAEGASKRGIVENESSDEEPGEGEQPEAEPTDPGVEDLNEPEKKAAKKAAKKRAAEKDL